MLAFVVLSEGGRSVNAAIPPAELADRLAIAAGLGIEEIRITGTRHAHDNDVFAALALDRPTSVLQFDADAARRRVVRLAWIKEAAVTRILPGIIEVRVRERTPAALWLMGETATLVDDTGQALARVAPTTRPDLLRIAGDDAPLGAAELVAAIASSPVLAGRLLRATRVGGRRWSLLIEGGGSIELPADGVAEALERLARLGSGATRDLATGAHVDLRLADRIALSRPAARPRAAHGPSQGPPPWLPSSAL